MGGSDAPGWKVNLKRVHRLYREEKLMARRLKRKRITGITPLAPHLTGPDQEWAIDFVADAILKHSIPDI